MFLVEDSEMCTVMVSGNCLYGYGKSTTVTCDAIWCKG